MKKSILKRFASFVISLFMLEFIPFPVDTSFAYNYLIYGIDVSSYQENINWSAVRGSNVDFAIIRTGTTNYNQEVMRSDSYFVQNYSGAKENGIKVGAYYFTSAFTREGMVQNAYDCINTLGGRSLDYPVFIDIENDSKSTRQVSLGKTVLTDYLIDALNVLSSAGYMAGVYSSKSFLESYVDLNRIRSLGFYVWMAQYPSGSYAVNPAEYDKSDRCSIWQYSDRGSVSGVNGNCDVDVCYTNFQPVAEPDGEKYTVATESSNLNIRSQPQIGDNIIGKAPKDSVVTVLEILSDGSWAKVYYNGITGYCSMSYLKKVNSETAELKQPLITTDKDSYKVGETAHISWVPSPSDSNLSHYWITIDGPNGNLINQTMDLNTSYDFTFAEAGSYLIYTYATPKGSLNGEGSLIDQKTLLVEPKEPVLSATAEEIHLNVGRGESTKVYFTYSDVSESVKKVNLSYSESEYGILNLSWGDWDKNTIPLNISGRSKGETDVTVYLKNADTDEVLKELTVHATVENTAEMSVTQSYEQPENIFSNSELNISDGEKTYGYLVISGSVDGGEIECSTDESSAVGVRLNGEDYKISDKKIVGFDVLPQKVGSERVEFTYSVNGVVVASAFVDFKVCTDFVILNFYDNGRLTASMEAQPGDKFEKYINIIKHEKDSGFSGWYDSEYDGTKYTDDMTVDLCEEVSLYAHYENSTLKGDVDGDGSITVSDAAVLQKWLLGQDKTTNLQNADINEDDIVDTFDMIEIRKLIY